jgi:UDP-GlcNAc3NAcA epimerase
LKVLTVIGARPQFIKAGPVSKAFRKLGIAETVVHTGQHYDHSMSQVFFDELGLEPPQINLNVGSGTHGIQTGTMLSALDPILFSQKPDWVLVYGDTNSTLAGALSAAKLHIPVAHVEAGLRSFNRSMPEELNRLVADTLSDLLFAPTEVGVANLIAEGVAMHRIHMVGDVMYDAALMYGQLAQERDTLVRLGLMRNEFSLATIHRAENTDNPTRLLAIADGLIQASKSLKIIWPVHPRTRKMLVSSNLEARLAHHITLAEPLGYLDMLQLERNAAVIVTDSGGVQKEAFFFRVPCVTLRDETEWTELIDLGWNCLCSPTDGASISAAILSRQNVNGRTGSPYGDGNAALKIAESLVKTKASSESFACASLT